MQTEPAETRRLSGRGQRGESRLTRAESRRKDPVSAVTGMRSTQTPISPEKKKGGHKGETGGAGWSEEVELMRWRVNQLEKDKLEVTSRHNQEVCVLETELTRLRSLVERGEAQRAELQYQLAASQRESTQVTELRRDKQLLTERVTQLQQTVQELQKVLEIMHRSREEDQHALQQEVEKRDKLIQSLSSENRQRQRILQEQEEALQELHRRMEELQRQQEEKLKKLRESHDTSRREKEQEAEQRLRALESSLEAERGAHLETKLRVRDLEAALVLECSGQQEAQCSLELLRVQFREVERAYNLERERSSSCEGALEQLQTEYEQYKSHLSAASEAEKRRNSELSEKLEEEVKRHEDTRLLLEQAAKIRRDTEDLYATFVQQIVEALRHHRLSGCSPAAVHDGKPSPPSEALRALKTTLAASEQRLEETEEQIQDQVLLSERLQQENQTLQQLTSDQSAHIQKSQEALVQLEEEVKRLRQESSDWSTQSHRLEEELQREREERAREVKKTRQDFEEESKVRLSFLYCLYQRLLAGCVLIGPPHSILGNFTWKELCDVISEHVDQQTADLQKAKEEISNLQAVNDKKSACMRELQCHQQRAFSHLEESVRRREDAWSQKLQVSRSQCESLRHHISTLERRLRVYVSKSRGNSSSLLIACTLLAGALKHTHQRFVTLREHKRLLCRHLAEREALEEEVRQLADALEGEGDKKEEEKTRGRGLIRRWRISVCAVLAVRRWCVLTQKTTVKFHLERGGAGLAVCTIEKHSEADRDDARWLRSKQLFTTIKYCMTDLQRALAHTDSTSRELSAAASSSLSRLMDRILDQSETACEDNEDTLIKRLEHGLDKLTPPESNTKVLVSTLQHHFLRFSQRLHSAELERRSLRVEAANQKRGLVQAKDPTGEMVSLEHFHRVCSELHQALNREQETQTLIQEQTSRLQVLQQQQQQLGGALTSKQQQLAMSHVTQALSE
ncbi:coiled-coil domain-containing protein 171, partial [Cynoglossus semilaevis]